MREDELRERVRETEEQLEDAEKRLEDVEDQIDEARKHAGDEDSRRPSPGADPG